MPAQKRNPSDEKYPLKLTVKQREALVQATRLTRKLKATIEAASNDQHFVEFTRKELDKMLGEIDISLAYATPSEQKRLNAVVDKIFDCLADIEEKKMTEKREAITEPGAMYQLQVTLKESHPPIWRRIQVPDCTLGQLHQVLQIVMGWDDSHLHQFIIRGDYYGPLDLDDVHSEMATGDEETISISQVAKMERKVRFIYEYDFGDSWQHEIVLEKILKPEPKVSCARCIEGARACPPEDVGGIWGYAALLEAISDPNHEDHDGTVDWVGDDFDPEEFDLNAVNRKLRKL
jgi:Plasmid pRiA4b ORF-3-like protein